MSQPESGNAPKSPVVAFNQLKEALAAGNLEQAQACYALVKQYAPAAAGEEDAGSAAFGELGNVLEEGDLGKAQVAFAFMQSMLEAHEAAQRKESPPAPVPVRSKVNIVG